MIIFLPWMLSLMSDHVHPCVLTLMCDHVHPWVLSLMCDHVHPWVLPLMCDHVHLWVLSLIYDHVYHWVLSLIYDLVYPWALSLMCDHFHHCLFRPAKYLLPRLVTTKNLIILQSKLSKFSKSYCCRKMTTPIFSLYLSLNCRFS